jgi:hypothetical protein
MSSAHFYKFGKERKNWTALIKEVHTDYREKHTHTNTHIYIHVHISTYIISLGGRPLGVEVQ